MGASKTYLVPVDFSKGSKIALRHAAALARKKKGKLVLLHVMLPRVHPLISQADAFIGSVYATAERRARRDLQAMVRRAKLNPAEYRSILLRRADAARVIADLARRLRVAMIVMSSHGRTGFRRFTLGSVAERAVRYADCPVLIVKK